MLGIVLNGEKLSRMQFNNSTSKMHYSFAKGARFQNRKRSFVTELDHNLAEKPRPQKAFKFSKTTRLTDNKPIRESLGPGDYDFHNPSKKRALSYAFGASVR